MHNQELITLENRVKSPAFPNEKAFAPEELDDVLTEFPRGLGCPNVLVGAADALLNKKNY